MNATTLPASVPEVYDECDRLVMLTPCYGGQQTVLFRDSVHVAMTQAPRASFRCADGKIRSLPILAVAANLPGDSHIDRARNNIVHDFLATHYRHALFCDGDQPFEPQDIATTWVRLMSGVRVIGGCVALKILKTTFACNTIDDIRTPGPDGLLPGRDTGTGWIGFKRDVLDEIAAKWPAYVRSRIVEHVDHDNDRLEAVIQALAECGLSADISYIANPGAPHAGQSVSAYFASGVAHRDGARDWLSEDWMFCLRCRLLGIPIKIDPSIRIKHLGPYLFPPPPEDLVAAALQVTSGAHPPFDKALADQAHAALSRLHHSITDDSISVLHATRGRPAQALRRREEFFAQAADPASFEYIFALDQDDLASIAELAKFPHVIVAPRDGIVHALNAAAAQSTGRILVMAADDCHPPQHWDRSIRERLRGQLHEPRLLWPSDGYSRQPVCTHPIITRALYDLNGGWFFCPEYRHLFCDTELTQRAQAAGQVIEAPDLIFRHDHPMFTGAAPDAQHRARNSQEYWTEGAATFRRRNPTAPGA